MEFDKNIVDIISLAIIAISILLGFSRGLIRECYTILAWILSFFSTIQFGPIILPFTLSIPFLEEFFTLLGEYTISADLKDFKVIDSLLFQLEEEYLGYGMMDQVYFLKRMQEICPDAQILVEHIPREKLAIAIGYNIKYKEYGNIQH